MCEQVYTFLLMWHHQYLAYSICYTTVCLYVLDNNSFEKTLIQSMQPSQKLHLLSPRHTQMQFDNLFIPQKKGRSSLQTKNKMRHMPFTSLFWQNLFPFTQHMFTPFADVSVLRHYQCSFRTHSVIPMS